MFRIFNRRGFEHSYTHSYSDVIVDIFTIEINDQKKKEIIIFKDGDVVVKDVTKEVI